MSLFWIAKTIKDGVETTSLCQAGSTQELRWIPLTERMPTNEDADKDKNVIYMWSWGEWKIEKWNRYESHEDATQSSVDAFLPLNWIPEWRGE